MSVQCGVRRKKNWIPAFAGMTVLEERRQKQENRNWIFHFAQNDSHSNNEQLTTVYVMDYQLSLV
jgi:hypothetical protein